MQVWWRAGLHLVLQKGTDVKSTASPIPLNSTAREMACAVASLYSTSCNNVGVALEQQAASLTVTLAIAQAVVSGRWSA